MSGPLQHSVKTVVFFGAFGPPSLTFARSCHAMGISVYLLTPGEAGTPARLRSTCFTGAQEIDAAMVGEPRGIEAIVDCSHRVGATALATISDAHCLWLARNRVHFESWCTLLLPPLECLEQLASKVHQIALARDAGLTVMPTYAIRSAADISRIERSLYPVCLRPAVPGASEPPFKVLMARCQDDLMRLVTRLRISGEGIIVQPFQVLPNMVVHCTSREGGELINAAAFLVDRKFEGLALRIKPMAMPSGLADNIGRFSLAAKLSGVYHFDFLYAPRTREAYFLEVNARFGGTTDKVMWLGVDEPANCLRAYGLVAPCTARGHKMASAVANKRATLKHLVTMFRRRPDPWDYPQESRVAAALHSLSDLVLLKDSIWDWQDFRGTVSFHLQGIIP